ncbi:unnamed protein product [Phytomonas sp. Hart1]|nr:unnamed protein product [Phytomonas sp. Hart1]|eukprot:CCW71664.1 unnamed protein product [Phytomonas sp. isolate Hart1]
MAAPCTRPSQAIDFDRLSPAELAELAKKQLIAISEKDAQIASFEEFLTSLMGAFPASMMPSFAAATKSPSPAPPQRLSLPSPAGGTSPRGESGGDPNTANPNPIPSHSSQNSFHTSHMTTNTHAGNRIPPPGRGEGPSAYRALGLEIQAAMENERIQFITRISELESGLALAEGHLRAKTLALTTLEGKVEGWKAKVVASKARDLRRIEDLRAKLAQREQEPLKPGERPSPEEDVRVEEDYSRSDRSHADGEVEETAPVGGNAITPSATNPAVLSIAREDDGAGFFSRPGGLEEGSAAAGGDAARDCRDELTRRMEGLAPFVAELQERCAALTGRNQTLERKVWRLRRFALAVLAEMARRVSHSPALVDAINEQRKELQI